MAQTPGGFGCKLGGPTHQIITDVDELGEEFKCFWGQILIVIERIQYGRTRNAGRGKAWPQRSGRGVDGWSYEELRQLPDHAIGHPGQIMQRIEADGSFPQPAMQARTVLLPKQARRKVCQGHAPSQSWVASTGYGVDM